MREKIRESASRTLVMVGYIQAGRSAKSVTSMGCRLCLHVDLNDIGTVSFTRAVHCVYFHK